MKLSKWAKSKGLSYRTAYRLFKAGHLPASQLPTGTILIDEEGKREGKTVLYARVSSHDQKADLERQMNRLRDFASQKGMKIGSEVSEIASGLNGNRRLLNRILADRTVTTIVVEHPDRLARFGVEMVRSVLSADNRKLLIINDSEYKDDLVQDFIDVVTSMCARIYGRRSAKNRAKKALEAVSK